MHFIHTCSSTRASTANVSASSELPLRPLHNLSQGIIQDLRSGSESNSDLLRLHDIVDSPAVRWEHPLQADISSLQFSEALTESALGRWAQDVEGIPRRIHGDNNTLPDIPASLMQPAVMEAEQLAEDALGTWAQDLEGMPRVIHSDNNTLPDIPASLIRPAAIEAESLTASALGTWAQDSDNFSLMEVSDPGSSGGESAIWDTESTSQVEPLTQSALGTWAQDAAGIPRTVVHK
ncbi:hypothetical protein GE278_23695 (plasmid) [Enterobacteriaceae bacterium Kacie_13]|nr:hypothetical protein GE278_23695 [Enterobacteriaceae bacterium Kacie_13]